MHVHSLYAGYTATLLPLYSSYTALTSGNNRTIQWWELKGWSTANTQPVPTDYMPNHFERPLRLYDVFKSVPDLCFTRLFTVLGKAKYHYRPLRASRKMTSWTLPSTLTFDLKTGWKTTKCHVKTRFITVWPWPLTYEHGLQSQPSQGQGQPSCQKSRS